MPKIIFPIERFPEIKEWLPNMKRPATGRDLIALGIKMGYSNRLGEAGNLALKHLKRFGFTIDIHLKLRRIR